MRTRIVLATFGLALTLGGVWLPAQEMPQSQIANWPAPALWEPAAADATSRTRGSIGTESILATTASLPLPFIAVTPCRIVDTRLSGGAFAAGETRTYAMSGGTLPCVSGFSAGVAAVSLNITVAQTAGTGFVTGFPAGASLPLVASLTWIGANQTLSNAAIVPTGTSTSVNIYASQATHVILDINGYYAGAPVGSSNTFLGTRGSATMTGGFNTAIGMSTFISDTTGGSNTAVGDLSLVLNTTGNFNTAVGVDALYNNDVGNNNTAVGFESLNANTGGTSNTGIGNSALISNATGSNNTAVGDQALFSLGSGIRNVGIGANAGYNLTAGDDNVYVASLGLASESNTIRIGALQNRAYIVGIHGVTTGLTAIPVVIDANGQLGTTSSSARAKEQIRDMGEVSSGLLKLRPVTFHYKGQAEGSNPLHFGLIAEEVDEVLPELVVHRPSGEAETILYHEMPAMLLNELQKQQRTIERQQTEIEDLKAHQQVEIERLEADLSALRALVGQH